MLQSPAATVAMVRPAVCRLVASRSMATAASAALKNIGVIPADGIGKEVMPCAQQVAEAVGAKVQWVPLEAGFELFQKTGTALPQATIDTLKNECAGALFGAVSSPSHKVAGYSSPIVALRKHLDLYANVRPVVSSPVAGSVPGVDCVIVRENTECLYVKSERIEDAPQGRRAVADRVITEAASKRIARMAYDLAVKREALLGRPGKVTVVHKSNVLSVTDGLFRESCLKVAEESQYKSIKTEEQLVDSCVYRLFRDPQSFDVIVAPNMYGDIVSDGAAAVVGGLGIVPSANMSDSFVLAEPVHGSAPDIAGKGIANPIAMIRCVSLLLQAIGEGEKGVAVEEAVQRAMKAGIVTPDLGGKHSTQQVTDFIAKEAKSIVGL